MVFQRPARGSGSVGNGSLLTVVPPFGSTAKIVKKRFSAHAGLTQPVAPFRLASKTASTQQNGRFNNTSLSTMAVTLSANENDWQHRRPKSVSVNYLY
jgi:hypothetical protein